MAVGRILTTKAARVAATKADAEVAEPAGSWREPLPTLREPASPRDPFALVIHPVIHSHSAIHVKLRSLVLSVVQILRALEVGGYPNRGRGRRRCRLAETCR